MKYFYALVFLLLPLTIFSQDDSVKHPVKKLTIDDSAVNKMLRYKDSMINEMQQPDTPLIQIRNTNNYEYILELQKKNREKQRRAAYIRIGIGVFFLLLLIYSFIRKRKKQNS